MSTTRRRGRPPRKAPDGLNRVLFVRCDDPMLDVLDRVLERRRIEYQRPRMSRADLVREILQTACTDALDTLTIGDPR